MFQCGNCLLQLQAMRKVTLEANLIFVKTLLLPWQVVGVVVKSVYLSSLFTHRPLTYCMIENNCSTLMSHQLADFTYIPLKATLYIWAYTARLYCLTVICSHMHISFCPLTLFHSCKWARHYLVCTHPEHRSDGLTKILNDLTLIL